MDSILAKRMINVALGRGRVRDLHFFETLMDRFMKNQLSGQAIVLVSTKALEFEVRQFLMVTKIIKLCCNVL